MIVTYTHPGNPDTVMRAYRTFLLSLKGRWMGHGRGNRCLRGHMKYMAYVQEYLAAKRLILAFSAAGQVWTLSSIVEGRGPATVGAGSSSPQTDNSNGS